MSFESKATASVYRETVDSFRVCRFGAKTSYWLNAARMKRVGKIGAAAIFFFITVSAWALDPSRHLFQYNWRNWTRQNGLPVNGINALAQTSDGYLWLGTAEGLIRFDGVEFETMEFGRSIKSGARAVRAIAPALKGGVWVSIQYTGFGLFDGSEYTPARGTTGPVRIDARALLEDRDGTLYVAAQQLPGALKPSEDLRSLFRIARDEPNFISVFLDAQGRLWFGTPDSGACYWKDGKVNWLQDLEHESVSCFAQGPDGNIWIGTANGVWCYDANLKRKDIPPLSEQVTTMLMDRQGVLWIGSTVNGVARYRKGEYEYLRRADGLAGNFVQALLEDTEGNIWIGTSSGLTQLTDVKFPSVRDTAEPQFQNVSSVCASKNGGIWMGSSAGLSYHDGKAIRQTFRRADLVPTESVKRVYEAKNGDVYFVAGLQSLGVLSEGKLTKVYRTKESMFVGLGEDEQGVVVSVGPRLCRVTPEGIAPYVFDGETPNFIWILNVAPSRDGSIWIACEDGVVRIKNGKVLAHYNANDGFIDQRVQWVYEDSEGIAWMATLTSGFAFLKDGKIHAVDRHAGLPDGNIYAIIPDSAGNLWVDSARGIFRLSRQNVFDFVEGRVKQLDCTLFDGVESVIPTDKTLVQEHVACVSNDGRIWLPTPRGAVCIDPAKVPSNHFAPPVHITRVLANGTRLGLNDRIVPPGEGEMEFHFTAPNFLAPTKTRFKYQLKGYDEKWVDAGLRRIAVYTNLKPGRYAFQVTASNGDGVESPASDAFEFELKPHVYQTLWFRLLCGGLGCALLAGVYVTRVKNLERAQHELEDQVRLRTAELGDLNTSLVREVEKQKRTEEELVERTRALEREIEERKQMQAEIEQVHRELVDASRRAGMAEIATNVLHNVGNVLNSVNVSSSVALDLVRQSSVAGLGKVVALIRERKTDLGEFLTTDPRGKHVIDYLDQLSECLRGEQTHAVEELVSLRNNIEHIRDIVAMQQSYATVSGVKEIMDIRDLVEDSVRMNLSSLERDEIRIVREFEKLPPVSVDKHKVLQILVNFVRNAEYACVESKRPDKEIIIRIRRVSDRIQISVTDNGVGIPPENLTRIFNHGFTTRKGGHGFGLHSGALAAKELGGSVAAQSDGVGKGATFTLELPVALEPTSSSAPADPR